MSGNRSLDEFVEAGSGDGSGGGGAPAEPDAGAASPQEPADDARAAPADVDECAADAGDDPVAVEGDREAPEPPTSTYVWRPSGGTCAACGSAADERWRDGTDLVCAGCKEW